jgi:uncharacterized membrane protein YphA (DoxX/SURF4 family)
MKRTHAAAALAFALAAVPGRALAHVRYVTEDGGTVGAAREFLFSVLAVPLNAALLGGGALALAAVGVAYLGVRPFRRDVTVLRARLREYEAYLPWMFRLALGLPLVGAGYAGYLFTPAVPADARLLGVGIGFLLLFGLATRFVALVGLVAYGAAALAEPAVLLAFEYVGGFAALALLGSGKPSADDLLKGVADAEGTAFGRIDPVHRAANALNRTLAPFERYAPLAVRLALGATFVGLGAWEKLAHPGRALAVVAKYDLTALVPVDPGLWVVGAALVEIAVGLCLLTGLFTRAAAAAAFVVLTTTLFGLPDDPVLAHVTLFGLSSALFVTGSGPLALDRGLSAVSEPLRKRLSRA